MTRSPSSTFLPSVRLSSCMKGAGVRFSSAKQYGAVLLVPAPTLPPRQAIPPSHPGWTGAVNIQRPADASLAPEANRRPLLPTLDDPLGEGIADDAAFARCRVLLFRGRGVISALVRWQTRSVYSHAALLLPDGQILESWQGAGVRVRSFSDWSGVECFSVHGATPAKWRQAVDFGLQQVGSGYDYVSVLRFISRRNAPDNGRWFCSELVAAALQVAGLPLLSRVDPAEVSPAMLSWSPLLVREVRA